MVAVDQNASIRQGVADIVAEGEFLELEAIGPEQCLMGDRTEGDDHFETWHGGQFCLEVGVALADFGRGWLIGRRQATNGIGDAAIAQLHVRVGPKVSPQRLRLAGKAETMQSRIEQFAGNVAGKWPAGPVGPFLAGAEADDEQFGIQRTKGRNRQGMPFRVTPANVGEVLCQTRAGNAGGRVLKSGHGGDGSMAAMQLHWDIFCRVIDNYGDIGVCWRLARQLSAEHGRKVRLWVDDLASLQPLCPLVDLAKATQSCRGIEIRQWTGNAVIDRPAEVVIEAFACELPTAYLQAMAACTPKPCWINLEYLTAEPWAEEWHGMASPHPSLALTKYFFFPGFSAKSGGLLWEAGLLNERDHWIAENPAQNSLEISLFCYDTAPVGDLLGALARSPTAVTCHVPHGKPLAAVAGHLGGSGPWQLGKALIKPIPFMPMDDYDRLLWGCDINFVRGEDSFVRAQWAGKPFVWQIYAQDEDAHLAKLEAFLDRYCAGMDATHAAAMRKMFIAWNTGKGVESAWQEFVANREFIARYNRDWASCLASVPDMATGLVNFCASKV